MSYTEREVKEARKRAGQRIAATQRPRLEAYHQAAVRAEQMTGHPAWDHFLSLLQRRLDDVEADRADAVNTLTSPTLVDDAEMRTLKASISQCDAAIATYREVMDLPKKLIEQGERALDALMADDNASSESSH